MITSRKLTKAILWGVVPFSILGALIFWTVYRTLSPTTPGSVRQGAPDTVDSGGSQADPFREAVNRAMSAAELTQTAQSASEWGLVAGLWQEAIDLMKVVPESSDRYAIAQQRVQEYPINLQYAQQQAERSAAEQSKRQAAEAQQGEKVFEAVQGVPQLDGLLSGTPVVQIMVPEDAWSQLSKAEQVSLTYYAEHMVDVVRASPDAYVGVPSSAPAYDQFVSKASNLCPDCWQVVVGQPFSIGTFLNRRTVVQGEEPWNKEAPCCRGIQASEFRSTN